MNRCMRRAARTLSNEPALRQSEIWPAQGGRGNWVELSHEVKGRAAGAPTITVTKNEVLTSLNKLED